MQIMQIYRSFSARLQYIQCVSTGDAAVLHWVIDMFIYVVRNHSVKIYGFNKIDKKDIYRKRFS